MDTTKARAIELVARKLLDAMDQQFGAPRFSMNVDHARSELRSLLPVKRNEADRSRAKAA